MGGRVTIVNPAMREGEVTIATGEGVGRGYCKSCL